MVSYFVVTFISLKEINIFYIFIDISTYFISGTTDFTVGERGLFLGLNEVPKFYHLSFPAFPFPKVCVLLAIFGTFSPPFMAKKQTVSVKNLLKPQYKLSSIYFLTSKNGDHVVV
jgi:hypothetical protein